MRIVSVIVLLGVSIYTLGFAISLWKDQQRFAALAVFCLTLSIVILPFFSIFD